MKKRAIFRSFAYLLCLLLFFSCTGCAATLENVFAGYKVDDRVSLKDIPTPAEGGSYKVTRKFAQLDLDKLATMCFGDAEYEQSILVNRKVCLTASGIGSVEVILQKEDDGWKSGKPYYPPESNTDSFQFFRTDANAFAFSLYTRMVNECFVNAHGGLGNTTGEPADGDPVMTSAKEKADAFMEAAGYTTHRLDFAYKYSTANLTEMARLFCIDDADVPKKDLYWIRYRLDPKGLPENSENPNLYANFLFDEDGLYMICMPSEWTVTPETVSAPISAEQAFRKATDGLGWKEFTLFDAEYLVRNYSGRYHTVWSFCVAKENDRYLNDGVLTQYQLDAAQAKGTYELKYLYVDAATGERITGMALMNMPVRFGYAMITRHNSPELFK
jgi:hypothetical protein